MANFKKTLLGYINHIGTLIPRSVQRKIVEFPGVLSLIEKFSRNVANEITTPEGYRIVVNPLFHANLLRSGSLLHYEPDMRKAITQLTKPNMVAYDVGANVGIFAFLFASLVGDNGKVYAFEPEKNNYFCFEKSLKINTVQNIAFDKRALGNTQGSGSFDRRGGAFSGRLIGKDPNYAVSHNIETVPTASIDYLVREEGYRAPDILKIDVEGNEGMVLEGMLDTLSHYHPIVICELHGHLGDAKEKVIQLLYDYNYDIYDMEQNLISNALDSVVLNQLLHIIAIKKP
jgi:FkbM family methyltransferase